MSLDNVGSEPRLGPLPVVAWRLAVPAVAVGVWQLAYELKAGSRVLLPSPAAVWDAGLSLHRSGLLWSNLSSTLGAALVALALAALVGIPIGIGLGMLPRTWTVLAPFLNALNSMPRIAFAPVFVVAFGIGQGSKIALGFSVAVFVFLMNARIGVLSADEEQRKLCMTLGASRLQLFRKLYVPVAIPAIFTALRLGIVFALLGVVSSEIIASKDGVGQLITSYSATLSMAPVYALLIVVAVFTSILTMVVGTVESALLGWQGSSSAAGRLRRRMQRAAARQRAQAEIPVLASAAASVHEREGDLAVQLQSVSIEFTIGGSPPHRVLTDLNLEVKPGEFVAVIGASGSGKTTILNLVSGLAAPSSGSISVFDDVAGAGRTDVGYMFARDALLPWRTALQNVELGLELQGWARRARDERASRMLDRVRLSAAAHMYPSELSQGMRQRVALARTWVTEPELLLMDEPFAALDALTRSSVRDAFLDIWNREAHRKTVLFVTHDLTEALLLADRVITIARGSVQSDVPVPYARPRDPSRIGEYEGYELIHDRLRRDLGDQRT